MKNPYSFDSLDTFTRSYIEAMLWASVDDDDNPLDELFAYGDFSEDAKQKIIKECASFQRENAKDIGVYSRRAGHDFFLTRNHHGAGFWDGDWPSREGRRLTESSDAYGEQDVYVCDDGRLYLFG